MASLCEGGNEHLSSLKAISRKFQLHTEPRPQIVSSTKLLSIVRSRNMFAFSSDERAFNIESYFRTDNYFKHRMFYSDLYSCHVQMTLRFLALLDDSVSKLFFTSTVATDVAQMIYIMYNVTRRSGVQLEKWVTVLPSIRSMRNLNHLVGAHRPEEEIVLFYEAFDNFTAAAITLRKRGLHSLPSPPPLLYSVGKTRQGLLLVYIILQGTTINSDAYVATLKKLQARLSRVRRHREKQDFLLLHDNAQPYVSQRPQTRSENSDRQH
ncbi:hypothetical protein ANN_23272 [Periplaneta americana]|uniref:Uncharacterized protein n=1 Tax=Periplaneta americana TaxID=6978 RepID=A0ABQ8SLJ0_PERAM|nr:hypothetical protein ANN_23272 [Periplaneta americana]